MCPPCILVYPVFSGGFRMSRCVRLVFWCVQNVSVCPACFLCVKSVFPCVLRVAVCPPCILVYPEFFLVGSECRGMSALFSGVSRVSRCVRLVSDVSRLFSGVSRVLSGVSRASRCVRLVLWRVQSVVLCPPCFLLCLLECL